MPAAITSRAVGLDANGRPRAETLLFVTDGARHGFVDHDKEHRHRDAKFASGAVASLGAGRGHRRGLDGPTMPNPTTRSAEFFPRECFLPARHAGHGEAGELVL